MSDRLPASADMRRQFIISCGRSAVTSLSDDPFAPIFLENSLHLERLISDYGVLRQQFVQRHGMASGLLANHKVAALYIWLLSKIDPSSLFLFPANAPLGVRRLALVNMMHAVVVGALQILPERVDSELQADLEYCLLKETPENLEWLCFAMHALCRLSGKATNLRRY
ncbi:hypothetical protein [Azospirillum himalayense]|uniref:Uncharacterized protein n=1 Tax=Azospirillum himalayense TaxID=654847 RepID=A0ABW0GGM7_9PROT